MRELGRARVVLGGRRGLRPNVVGVMVTSGGRV